MRKGMGGGILPSGGTNAGVRTIQVWDMRQARIDWVVHRSVCLEFGLPSKPACVVQLRGRQRELSPQSHAVTLSGSVYVGYSNC